MRGSFWLLLSGQAVSVLGDAFGNLAMAWLVYDLTGSKLAMGSLYLIGFIPQLLLWILGSPLVDRLDRRRLMVVLDGVRALAYVAPPLLSLTGNLQLWHLYLLNFVAGSAGALFQPASLSMMPRLVAKEQLVRANSITEGLTQAMSLAGPVLAGLLIVRVSAHAAMAVDAISFGVSAITLLLLPKDVGVVQGQPAKKAGYFAQVAAGFRFYATAPALLIIMILLGVSNMGGTAVGTMLIPFAQDHLGAEVTLVGILQSAVSLGLLAGSFLTGLRGDVQRRRLPMLISLMVSGSALASLSLTSRGQVYWPIAALFLFGAAVPFFNTYNHSIYQRMVPDHLRGRVMSVRLLVGQGMRPVGAFVGALIAETAGLPTMFRVLGLLPAVLAFLALFLPVLTKIDGELAPLDVA